MLPNIRHIFGVFPWNKSTNFCIMSQNPRKRICNMAEGSAEPTVSSDRDETDDEWEPDRENSNLTDTTLLNSLDKDEDSGDEYIPPAKKMGGRGVGGHAVGLLDVAEVEEERVEAEVEVEAEDEESAARQEEGGETCRKLKMDVDGRTQRYKILFHNNQCLNSYSWVPQRKAHCLGLKSNNTSHNKHNSSSSDDRHSQDRVFEDRQPENVCYRSAL
ncbi:uncharacterized protein LOC134455322 [Engraulis encrasicolus]|uniref:uncharacterized protein LOC134455322 n=1 Tax=Engraulis encrasicolus TaxID=184585 RepID=UPI002FD5E239